MAMKMKQILGALALVLLLSISDAKKGKCPVQSECPVGADNCTKDNNCPNREKCCSVENCGKFCTEPVKSGSCPSVVVGPCDDDCSSDFDCPKKKKCCSNGCGHVCVKAAKSCEDKPKYKTTFKIKVGGEKLKCKKCSCQDIAEADPRLKAAFCLTKKGQKKCCATCTSN